MSATLAIIILLLRYARYYFAAPAYYSGQPVNGNFIARISFYQDEFHRLMLLMFRCASHKKHFIRLFPRRRRFTRHFTWWRFWLWRWEFWGIHNILDGQYRAQYFLWPARNMLPFTSHFNFARLLLWGIERLRACTIHVIRAIISLALLQFWLFHLPEYWWALYLFISVIASISMLFYIFSIACFYSPFALIFASGRRCTASRTRHFHLKALSRFMSFSIVSYSTGADFFISDFTYWPAH